MTSAYIAGLIEDIIVLVLATVFAVFYWRRWQQAKLDGVSEKKGLSRVRLMFMLCIFLAIIMLFNVIYHLSTGGQKVY